MLRNIKTTQPLNFCLFFCLIVFCFVFSFLFIKLVQAETNAGSIIADTDNDGLNDSLELKFKTDPLNPDSDQDGYQDGAEVYWGYNPLASSTKKLAQKIIIDLKNQKLKYLVADIILKEFSVSSGKASMKTPTGNFKIINKNKKAWSNTYKLWMPYWLGLGNGSFGIHELPLWPNGYREGADHLGKPVSHGCIRLGIGAAQYIYERVSVGTSVIIN